MCLSDASKEKIIKCLYQVHGFEKQKQLMKYHEILTVKAELDHVINTFITVSVSF